MSEDNLLSNFVSNNDKDIYTVFNLPEEVIATIFAYVSRSSKSFRENILKVTEEKAQQFHEKWVVNYGHSSVAELATVHLGIERVSRLFSALLERSNLYISPIEYSQRYQKPKNGDFYIPPELNQEKYISLRNDYIEYQNTMYDKYIELFNKLMDYYKKNESLKENETPQSFEKRIEKTSFEDARYILTLAVYTNMGLTSNARAMEDVIIYLLSSEYSELRNRGEEIKNEVLQSLPTLVKYANKSHHQIETRNCLNNNFTEIKIPQPANKHSITLINYTSISSNHPENTALTIILSELLYPYKNTDSSSIYNSIDKEPFYNKVNQFMELMKTLDTHGNPSSVLEKITYHFEFLLSESCWHQFLRHRKIDFNWQYPTIDNGYIIPPSIKDSGSQEIFESALDKTRSIHDKLKKISPLLSHYTVTNAHYRRVSAEITLWEIYHLINLRMTPQAQWDIKNIVTEMVHQIEKVHPHIIKPALDRLKIKLDKL